MSTKDQDSETKDLETEDEVDLEGGVPKNQDSVPSDLDLGLGTPPLDDTPEDQVRRAIAVRERLMREAKHRRT
jgi:hypothetical protein